MLTMPVAAPKTLDIKEPEILRHFPGDANAFYWHHGVLLSKVSPGTWIALTPDEDLERIDLHNTAHIQLEQRSGFPGPQSPYVYAFDELGGCFSFGGTVQYSILKSLPV